MTKEEYVALDIYTHLFRTYYGTDKEEIEHRIKYGSNGAVDKVHWKEIENNGDLANFGYTFFA